MAFKKTIADIDVLLDMGVGDPFRLEHIKRCHLQNKTLYKADENYLEYLVDKYIVKYVDEKPADHVSHTEDAITCSGCGAEILSDQAYCPSCADPPKQQNNSNKFCEGCGGPFDPNDASCPQCGQANTSPSNPAWPLKSKKNTLVLSIVFGLVGLVGLGHLYLGKFRRGVGLIVYDLVMFAIIGIIVEPWGWTIMDNFNSVNELLSFFAGLIVLGIISITVFIWQIFNARKLCKEYNTCINSNGIPPW